MSVIFGLPAHILLNHFIVVLAPLTAVLLILAALWPAARQRLVWLILALAVTTVALTPPTVRAGEWLADRVDPSPELTTHMDLGGTTIYFSIALLFAAVLLAGLQLRLAHGNRIRPVLHGALAVVVIATAAASLVQMHRIGESGARAAWGSCCQQ